MISIDYISLIMFGSFALIFLTVYICKKTCFKKDYRIVEGLPIVNQNSSINYYDSDI